MQTMISYVKLISLGILISFGHQAVAQKAVNGNGNIQEKKRIVKKFTTLNVQLNGTIYVHLGQQSHVVVKTDDNLISMVRTKVSSTGVLTIDQDGWPEPSKGFVVHVFTPYLTKIEGDSWSDIEISDIEQDFLTINKDLGSMKIEGRVNDLTVDSKQAKMDFSKLIVRNARINLEVRAKLTLCCAESVVKTLDRSSKFILLSDRTNDEPAIEKTKVQKPKYVSFSLINNSYTRKNFVVRGPLEAPFSYGFALMPYFAKKERWPVGTKIYRESLSGETTLLRVVKLKDADSKIKLYND